MTFHLFLHMQCKCTTHALDAMTKTAQEKMSSVLSTTWVRRKWVLHSRLEASDAHNWKCSLHPFPTNCVVLHSSSHPCCRLRIRSMNYSFIIFKCINVVHFSCFQGTAFSCIILLKFNKIQGVPKQRGKSIGLFHLGFEGSLKAFYDK